ncbi:MAG: hypothetical protein LYZ69_00045 [Nitrososphaerales archaeon]|nr:hypothetical protein [Nitrososphaerales archaeon]
MDKAGEEKPSVEKMKTTVEWEKELDNKFRKAVVERKGFRKGALGEAVSEAVEWWVDPRIHSLVEKYLKEKK